MWSVQDWRGDDLYDELDNRERGIYRELIDQCWVAGSITSDPEYLARFVGEPIEYFARFWAKARKKFRSIEGGARLTSKRLEEDRRRLENVRKKRKKVAKTAAKARWNHTDLNTKGNKKIHAARMPEAMLGDAQIQNQIQIHKEERTEDYPHQQHSPSPKTAADNSIPKTEFVEQVLALYVGLPCTPNRPTEGDTKVAAEIETRGFSIAAVECGMLQVAIRKVTEGVPVKSLLYFTPAIDDAASKPIPADYLEYHRRKLADLKSGKTAEVKA